MLLYMSIRVEVAGVELAGMVEERRSFSQTCSITR